MRRPMRLDLRLSSVALLALVLIGNNQPEEQTVLDPGLDYSGQECRYFTRASVEADGARLNYYADGAIVVYGGKTYECVERRWRLFANKPDLFPDWKERQAGSVEGTAINLEPAAVDPKDRGKSPGSGMGNQGGPAGNGSSLGAGANTARPAPNASEIRNALQSEIPLIDKRRSENDRVQSSRADSDLNAGNPGKGGAFNGGRLPLDACSAEMNRRSPPARTGNQCVDAANLIRFLQESRDYMANSCAAAPEVVQMVASLDDQIAQTQAYKRSICL